MRDFKKFTATQIRKRLDAKGFSKMIEAIRIQEPKRVFKVWDHRFHEEYIKSREMLERVLDYIHLNPLQEKWSLVEFPEEYGYSSALFYEKEKNNGLEVVHYMEYF